MSLPLPPGLETKIRAPAEAAEGSIEACLKRLVHAEQQRTEELEALALQEPDSGAPIERAPPTGKKKHNRLDEGLKKTETR
jgi:hypothetical protein